MGEHRSEIFEEKSGVNNLELKPHQEVILDTENTMLDKESVNFRYGIEARAIAGVDLAEDKLFIILDLRDDRKYYNDPTFLVIDETFNGANYFQGDHKGYVEIFEDSNPVVFGRNHSRESFSYPSTVSRDHFRLQYQEGVLVLENLNPLNSTKIIKNGGESLASQWERDGRTVDAVDRAEKHPQYIKPNETAPYGYHLNHAIIGRNSPTVKDGVYLGGKAREAIVVDADSSVINERYKNLERNINGGIIKLHRNILRLVKNETKNAIKYNAQKTTEISKPYYDDKLVDLSKYIKSNAGVCRHQALLAALFLENLIRDGYLDGKAWVERNTILDEDGGGTHAWAIFESREGKSYVVDPAQDFVGTKERAREDGLWDYYLSTD